MSSYLMQSPPTDATSTRRGLISTAAQVFAGAKTFLGVIVASAGVQLSALWNTNGTGASDVGVRAGVSTADASVNAAARLLSVRTGIGGSEIEYAAVFKNEFDVFGSQTIKLKTSLSSGNANGAYLTRSGGSGGLGVIGYGSGGRIIYNGDLEFWADTNANISAGTALGTTNVARLTADGLLAQSGTDSSGSPGAATINKPTGKSAIASSATSVTITNSLVAAGDQVHVTWHGDLGAQSKVPWVTTAAGSFTVNVGTAPAGAVPFCWTVAKRI